MKPLRNSLAAVCTFLTLTLASLAQEPIRFARMPDIAPDGKTIAFSYRGDIWTVDTIGGVARPVTMHPAHDILPAFSPDGRSLAFSSNRFGSYDVFVVAAQGGSPKRLTFDSASDYVCGWTPDGKNVLFASTRSPGFPAAYDLYTVPVEGGRVRRITTGEGRDGVFSPKGDQVAYVRGPGAGMWYRKGYRGSANDDIWICNADGSNNRQITSANCQDDSPMWSADGKFLYYVSEVHGTPANIVKQELGANKLPQRLTSHKDDGVRRARISADGEWIVYECGADLWVASTREGQPPRKLAIEVNADDKINPEKTVTLTDGATEYALSWDEKHFAFVVHGQVFLMPLDPGGKVTRLTNDASFNHGIAWSPDSTKIIYSSDRNGHEDLYLLEAEEAGKKLHEVGKFKTKQITDTSEPKLGVGYAPDGTRAAFLRAGQLWTMKPDGSEQKVLVPTSQVIDYEWSPDSKWIAYARSDSSFASEVYIIAATGGEAHNVTRYATFNSGITWSKTGMKLAFISQRPQLPEMYVLSLQKPAAGEAPASSDIDWDDIHLRAEAVASVPAADGAISTDGSKVAFRSFAGRHGDLWVASTGGGQVIRLTTGDVGAEQIQWSRRGLGDTIYFRDAKGTLRMCKLSLAAVLGSSSSGGKPNDVTVPVPFKVHMTIRQDEEFLEMFEQSWRALLEHFYDPKFHGVDWAALHAKYRPLVQHCALKEDLYALISLMLGELNASHLGISPAPDHVAVPEEETADLGLIFDDRYEGPGLKVTEVLKRGPADKRGLKIQAGDIVVAIDGTELTPDLNLSKLLNGRVGETISLQLVAPGVSLKDPLARRKVDVQGVSRRQVRPLMYERWVAQNAQKVNELSKGKLGYIHIPDMEEEGLARFVRALYSDNVDKDAIVLDVRFNGGGFTHDQVLNYLGGREHTLFRQRDGTEGWVMRSGDRKWSKPLIVLMNNQSFSDAEIFPDAFRTLGLGKLVGQPTGGMVIGTTSIRLIDGSQFRIPRTGVYTLKGVNMEREGVTPDILVENHPDQLAKGQDAQLEKAIEVLQQDVTVWKTKHSGSGVAIKPEVDNPGPVAPTPPTGNK